MSSIATTGLGVEPGDNQIPYGDVPDAGGKGQGWSLEPPVVEEALRPEGELSLWRDREKQMVPIDQVVQRVADWLGES